MSTQRSTPTDLRRKQLLFKLVSGLRSIHVCGGQKYVSFDGLEMFPIPWEYSTSDVTRLQEVSHCLL